MKKNFLKISLFVIVSTFALTSCTKNSNAVETSPATATEQPEATDSTASTAAPTETPAPVVENSITANVGKTAEELKLFSDVQLSERLKKMVGKDYDAMVKNFNVQTPVVEENHIYKLTGCKTHDCPAYQTTILYDKNNDNFNVLIDQNGKITELQEKGEIDYSASLKSK